MLSNKVSEIMTTNLTAASVSMPISKVIEIMSAEDVGRIIIMDNEVPVGIFTEKDVLRRVVNAQFDPTNTPIREVMTSPLRAVREETHIVEAFGKMYKGKYRHLLVRGRRGKIVGIVSMRRILKLAVELGQGMGDTKTLANITTASAVTVEPSSSVHQVLDVMVKKDVSAVIVGSSAKPMGIFTERDVLKRVAAKGLKTQDTAVEQVMTAPLLMMPVSASVGAVLAEMYRRDIRNMPVSGRHGELAGIVSMPDVLQYARAFDVDEQVRRTWKEVAEFFDTEDQYTPG
jgi:CBS domain-containing protein